MNKQTQKQTNERTNKINRLNRRVCMLRNASSAWTDFNWLIDTHQPCLCSDLSTQNPGAISSLDGDGWNLWHRYAPVTLGWSMMVTTCHDMSRHVTTCHQETTDFNMLAFCMVRLRRCISFEVSSLGATDFGPNTYSWVHKFSQHHNTPYIRLCMACRMFDGHDNSLRTCEDHSPRINLADPCRMIWPWPLSPSAWLFRQRMLGKAAVLLTPWDTEPSGNHPVTIRNHSNPKLIPAALWADLGSMHFDSILLKWQIQKLTKICWYLLGRMSLMLDPYPPIERLYWLWSGCSFSSASSTRKLPELQLPQSRVRCAVGSGKHVLKIQE